MGSARVRGLDHCRCPGTRATPMREDLLNSETAQHRQLSEAQRTPPATPREVRHRRTPPKVHAVAVKEPPRSLNLLKERLTPKQVSRAMLQQPPELPTALRRRVHKKQQSWSNDGAPSCTTLSRFSSRSKPNSSRSGPNSPPRSTSTPRQVPNLIRQSGVPRLRLVSLSRLVTVRSRSAPPLPTPPPCCSRPRPPRLHAAKTSSSDPAVMFASPIRLSLWD